MDDQILIKFDLWKDIVSQSSYFKSRPDPVILGGGESKILENAKRGGIGMKIGRENNYKS